MPGELMEELIVLQQITICLLGCILGVLLLNCFSFWKW